MGEALGRTLGVVLLFCLAAVAAMTWLALDQNPGLALAEAFVGAAIGLGGLIFGIAMGLIGLIIGFFATVFALGIAALAVVLAVAPIFLILGAPLIIIALIIWAASRG
ncbi:MAG: hypothetical protein AAFR11_12750 [Pseudomonadota bacterium]